MSCLLQNITNIFPQKCCHSFILDHFYVEAMRVANWDLMTQSIRVWITVYNTIWGARYHRVPTFLQSLVTCLKFDHDVYICSFLNLALGEIDYCSERCTSSLCNNNSTFFSAVWPWSKYVYISCWVFRYWRSCHHWSSS